jgi:hypothetical protein
MKEYYSKSSSVFIMFNCLIITLKSYHDYSYKFSSETLGKYLNNFKDMLSKLKEFLIICPNEENPKEELYSNLNQLIADFNQDFRDIISILKQLY